MNGSSRPRSVAPSADELKHDLLDGLSSTTEQIVPWFVKEMPKAYFLDTDHETRLTHLRAIVAGRASGQPLSIRLSSPDAHSYTFITERDRPGLLAQLVRTLPEDIPLRSAKVHSTAGGELVIDVFEFEERERYDPSDPDLAAIGKEILDYAKEQDPDRVAEYEQFLGLCAGEYVENVTPLRFGRNMALYQKVCQTDACAVHLEDEIAEPGYNRIVLAVGNARPRRMFERCTAYLGHRNVHIHRAYLDVFDDPGSGFVSLLNFVVKGPEGRLDESGALWEAMSNDLLRMKWLDGRALDLFDRHQGLDLTRAEIVVALSSLVHQHLSPENPYAFSRDRILRFVEENLPIAAACADLLLVRFEHNAPLEESEAQFQRDSEAVRERIGREVDRPHARRVLRAFCDAVGATLRTNIYLPERYAFAARFDPSFLPHPDALPYGAFFVHGSGFDAYHVRFRDIARGGVRAVCPVGAEQYAMEVDRHYQEAYGLAYAQQLKNKDIPEGGSKAVVLLAPDASVSRSVKAFANSLLDLVTPEEETRRLVVDRFGQQETLYLGPDENITPELIEWIVACAKRRGYPMHDAFMSSKPGAGINHKEYGVTSEGVTVFLDVALRAIGIDPDRDTFTVKLTGGPDGDVAGNEIRILHRDYGERARIVGLADGSGSAEDPDGLDHGELLRLFQAALPIAEFSRGKLGPKGQVTRVDEPGGVQARNTLHNRVVSDAFIPAGGRPQTISEFNYENFFTEDGKPSSRLVVEGANLFITPAARQLLFEKGGVVIVKDSSANKCGVICSGYEIIASMLFSESEFLEIKEKFVEDVLVRLRRFARREAELLFGEHRRAPQTPVPELSVRLSRVVDRTSLAIAGVLDGLEGKDAELAWQLVLDHLPPVLIDAAGSRIRDRIPSEYWKWAIAAALATRIVYREGLDYLDALSDEAVGKVAIDYLRQDAETTRLVTALRASDCQDREVIADLLERGGTRAGLSRIR